MAVFGDNSDHQSVHRSKSMSWGPGPNFERPKFSSPPPRGTNMQFRSCRKCPPPCVRYRTRPLYNHTPNATLHRSPSATGHISEDPPPGFETMFVSPSSTPNRTSTELAPKVCMGVQLYWGPRGRGPEKWARSPKGGPWKFAWNLLPERGFGLTSVLGHPTK